MAAVSYLTIKPDPNRPKLKGDWVGRLVRLRREVTTTGGAIFSAGVVMKVTKNWGGLHLRMTVICPCCALGQYCNLRGLSETSVDLLPVSVPDPSPETRYPQGPHTKKFADMNGADENAIDKED